MATSTKVLTQVAAAALAVLAFSSHASLVNSSDGLVDTATGLEWLDVTVNESISYDTMIATGLNGYGALGYRYATVEEVGALWVNAGLTSLPAVGFTFVGSTDAFAAADLLISMLGATEVGATNTYIQAISGTQAGSGHMAPWIRGTCLNGTGCAGGGSYGAFVASDTLAGTSVGHWLVRSSNPIPVPPSLTLVALGLVALGWSRRRQSV